MKSLPKKNYYISMKIRLFCKKQLTLRKKMRALFLLSPLIPASLAFDFDYSDPADCPYPGEVADSKCICPVETDASLKNRCQQQCDGVDDCKGFKIHHKSHPIDKVDTPVPAKLNPGPQGCLFFSRDCELLADADSSSSLTFQGRYTTYLKGDGYTEHDGGCFDPLQYTNTAPGQNVATSYEYGDNNEIFSGNQKSTCDRCDEVLWDPVASVFLCGRSSNECSVSGTYNSQTVTISRPDYETSWGSEGCVNQYACVDNGAVVHLNGECENSGMQYAFGTKSASKLVYRRQCGVDRVFHGGACMQLRGYHEDYVLWRLGRKDLTAQQLNEVAPVCNNKNPQEPQHLTTRELCTGYSSCWQGENVGEDLACICDDGRRTEDGRQLLFSAVGLYTPSDPCSEKIEPTYSVIEQKLSQSGEDCSGEEGFQPLDTLEACTAYAKFLADSRHNEDSVAGDPEADRFRTFVDTQFSLLKQKNPLMSDEEARIAAKDFASDSTLCQTYNKDKAYPENKDSMREGEGFYGFVFHADTHPDRQPLSADECADKNGCACVKIECQDTSLVYDPASKQCVQGTDGGGGSDAADVTTVDNAASSVGIALAVVSATVAAFALTI